MAPQSENDPNALSEDYVIRLYPDRTPSLNNRLQYDRGTRWYRIEVWLRETIASVDVVTHCDPLHPNNEFATEFKMAGSKLWKGRLDCPYRKPPHSELHMNLYKAK